MNDGGDCRTAPATPGLLNKPQFFSVEFSWIFSKDEWKSAEWLNSGCALLNYTGSLREPRDQKLNGQMEINWHCQIQIDVGKKFKLSSNGPSDQTGLKLSKTNP